MSINNSIKLINEFVKEKAFFDLTIKAYSIDNLLIVGSTDLSYYHNIEIWFNKVGRICCANDWHVDTGKPVLEIITGEQALAINLKYKILQGQTLVKLYNEDDVEQWIACESLSINIADVRYE